MAPDTIVDVYCEICEERIAQVRVGDLKYPMTGAMFQSPDTHHGYPAPFEPSTDWEYLRCPHCHFRPFLCEDRIQTGDRFIYALKGDQASEPEATTVDELLQQIKDDDVPQAEVTCEICGPSRRRRCRPT